MTSLWLHHQNLPQIGCLAGIHFFSPSPPPTILPLFPSLLLSVCRCTRPQRCMLTPVSKRTWVYDKHRSFLFPLPHFHPTPSRGHQGLLQSQREGEKENGKAEQIFKRPTMIFSNHRKSHDRYWVLSCK